MPAFSSCREGRLLSIAVCGLLIAVASLLQSICCRCAGSVAWLRAYLLQDTWNLPGPGIELVLSAVVGRFLSTVPPGKSYTSILKYQGIGFSRG